MITESFLNSCFSVILNKESRVKKTKMLYRDILNTLLFSEKRETVQIPIAIQSKLDCLRKICELLLTDKTIDNVLDSIFFSEKFNQYREFIDIKMNEELKERVFQDIVQQIRTRKKVNELFQNYDQLSQLVESVRDGSFEAIDNVVEDYEVAIKTLYSNMMESNRSTAIEAAASLDLLQDDFEHVLNMIKIKYDKSSKTSTGFALLDNEILWGGYEPSRLYVWGGGSGAGKSTILNNSLINAAIKNPLLMDEQSMKKSPSGKVDRVFVYVTMENTIEEALMRTYMPLYDRTIVDTLRDIKSGVDIKKKIVDKLKENGSGIVMKYFPPLSVSSIDLMGVVDDVVDEYGNRIAGLYVDYLDLLKTDTKYDIYRLELGQITLSLKTLAVHYNIPVITGTQLGRSAYKIQESSSLGVDQISESIKKVEHADFVGLLAKNPVDDTLVHGKVGKNRSGKSNFSFNFKVDFSRFKFMEAARSSNRDKADTTEKPKDERGFSFQGFHTL